MGKAGRDPDTKPSRRNATKKERSMGSSAITGTRERSIRTGKTTGAVKVVKTVIRI